MSFAKTDILTLFIAMVWFINGLYCKVLNFVPRHQEIVARILGETYSRELTLLIGLAEIGMTVWVLSGIFKKLNALTQIVVIMAMNVLEFILASDLLLWGRFNFVFASIFCAIIYQNSFVRIKN